MKIKIYKGAKLKEGAFLCVKNKLHKGDKYLSIKWFEKILTDKFNLTVLKVLTIYVAFDDTDTPIGCGIVFPWVYTKVLDHRLLSVFVLPKARKLGIGSALLKQMQKQDYPFKTKLLYHTDNKTGKLFYQKHSVAPLRGNRSD